MKNWVYTILGYLLILSVIILVFKLYKWHAIIEIDATDHTMEPDYKYGGHTLDISAQRVDQLTQGSAVAFYLPGNSVRPKVAYVVAIEGQRVAVRTGKVFVNEHPFEPPLYGLSEEVPEYVVPRGCAVLMARYVGEDSTKHGPIPMRNIWGRLK